MPQKSLCYGILQFVYSVAVTIFVWRGRKGSYFLYHNFLHFARKDLNNHDDKTVFRVQRGRKDHLGDNLQATAINRQMLEKDSFIPSNNTKFCAVERPLHFAGCSVPWGAGLQCSVARGRARGASGVPTESVGWPPSPASLPAGLPRPRCGPVSPRGPWPKLGAHHGASENLLMCPSLPRSPAQRLCLCVLGRMGDGGGGFGRGAGHGGWMEWAGEKRANWTGVQVKILLYLPSYTKIISFRNCFVIPDLCPWGHCFMTLWGPLGDSHWRLKEQYVSVVFLFSLCSFTSKNHGECI